MLLYITKFKHVLLLVKVFQCLGTSVYICQMMLEVVEAVLREMRTTR